MPRIRLVVATAVVGVLLLVVGAAVIAWRWSHPASFGWFAYAPLSDVTFTPDRVDHVAIVGYLCSVVGASVAGVAVGALVGRRRTR